MSTNRFSLDRAGGFEESRHVLNVYERMRRRFLNNSIFASYKSVKGLLEELTKLFEQNRSHRITQTVPSPKGLAVDIKLLPSPCIFWASRLFLLLLGLLRADTFFGHLKKICEEKVRGLILLHPKTHKIYIYQIID